MDITAWLASAGIVGIAIGFAAKDTLANLFGICQTPEPRVRFRELADSGLNFELLCWIDEPVLRGRSLDTMNEMVYKKCLKEGIEIPSNKQDIYINYLAYIQASYKKFV